MIDDGDKLRPRILLVRSLSIVIDRDARVGVEFFEPEIFN